MEQEKEPVGACDLMLSSSATCWLRWHHLGKADFSYPMAKMAYNSCVNGHHETS